MDGYVVILDGCVAILNGSVVILNGCIIILDLKSVNPVSTIVRESDDERVGGRGG